MHPLPLSHQASLDPVLPQPAQITLLSPELSLMQGENLANVHLLGPQPLQLAIAQPGDPVRTELEQFIASVFAQTHSACIQRYMPQLLSLRDQEGRLQAACGLRMAITEPLFLERYLQAPIETLLSAMCGMAVDRKEIVEVGNLAVMQPVHIRSLLASISLYLHNTDAEWAVFTATRALRNALKRLNIHMLNLGDAGIEALPDEERSTWGRYYETRPQVMAVRRIV